MAIFYGTNQQGYLQGFNDAQDRLRNKRKENAEAFRMFSENAVKEGRSITAADLEAERTRLAGGDNYFLKGLPADGMIKDITGRTNARVANSLLAEATKNMEQHSLQDKFINDTVDTEMKYEDWTGSMAERLGIDGPELTSRLDAWGGESRFNDVQDEKVQKRVDFLAGTQRFLGANEEADIDTLFGSENALIRKSLKNAKSNELQTVREGRVAASGTALRAVSDAALGEMTVKEIEDLVKSTLGENQILNPSDAEIKTLLGQLTTRRSAQVRITTKANKRAFIGDLDNSDNIRKIIESAQGTNLDEKLMLTEINKLANKHGLSFGSVEEFEEYMGDDQYFENYSYRAMSVQYTDADKLANTQAVAQANALRESGATAMVGLIDGRIARADRLEKEGEDVPVSLQAFRQGNVGYQVVDNIVERFVVNPSVGSRIISFIENKVQTDGLDLDPNTLTAEVVAQFSKHLDTPSTHAGKLQSQLMEQQGFTVRPGESIVTYHDDFVGQSTDLFEGLVEALEAADKSRYIKDGDKTIWFGAAQAQIQSFKQDISKLIQDVKDDFNSPQSQLFTDLTEIVDIDGQQVSGKEVPQAIIAHLEGLLTRIDTEAPTIQPTGGNSVTVANQPATGLPAGDPDLTRWQNGANSKAPNWWMARTDSYTNSNSIIPLLQNSPDMLALAKKVVSNTDENIGIKALRNVLIQNRDPNANRNGKPYFRHTDPLTGQQRAWFQQMYRLLKSNPDLF